MQITDAEWEVMESVWQADGQLPSEILSRIDAEGRSHRTFRALLARLVDKGAVTVTIDGSRHYYSAAVSREECVQTAAESFTQRFFAGDLKNLLLHLVERESLTTAEIDELQQQLAAAKSKRPKKSNRK
ncbi:MAG: BlaI/MecI/CopY family transcriptional regulator [Planctomycetales bacterium]|nr:BlaI/MecI/CopY family transcriptional regulator [Planctomycetales bacterium]